MQATSTTELHKIIRLGAVLIGKEVDVFCKITITRGNLSITGVEGPRITGECWGGAGQLLIGAGRSRILNTAPAPGWSKALIAKFVEVWERWHLNDMRRECEHQRAMGWTYHTHRNEVTHDGYPCPTCGYRIGSAWLREELPQWVVAFLVALPETDKQPAWV